MSNPGTTITYNGNSLQTANILTDTIDHHNTPDIDAKQYAIAHANRSKIPFISYPSKKIPVSGTIIGSSVADCDAQIDAFKSYLFGNDLNLDIGYNGGTRRYIATPNNIKISRPRGLTYAKFSVEFVCNDPFGHDLTPTIALNVSGRTSASYNTDNYTFLGTAPYQLPTVTITLTAVTGGTNQSIQWGNATNGQAIFVQRTWTSGDVLVIDCVEKNVTVNGFPAAFSGGFPEFPPGAQTMFYVDTFTTRTFTEVVQYFVGYF